MANPLFKNSKGESVNTPSNPLNESNKTYTQSKNTFNYDRPHGTTLSFADITPYEVVEGVGDDTLEFGNKHHLRTYTLGSTLMSDIYMKKSYYMLDMRAILPNNWEKIYREPAKGDDVPISGLANTYTQNLFNYLNQLKGMISSSEPLAGPADISVYMQMLFLFEFIFSDGGLLARMYNHYSSLVSWPNGVNLNTFGDYSSFDKSINSLYTLMNYENENTVLGRIRLYDNVTTLSYTVGVDMSFSTALEFARTYPERYTFTGDAASIASSFIHDIVEWFSGMNITPLAIGMPVNYSRLCAYQLVCAEYFTNDKIDDIYSSQLYLQNMRSLAQRSDNGYSEFYFNFVYNGVDTLYDSLSGAVLEFVFENLIGSFGDGSFNDCYFPFAYLFNLFGIRKSMRYGDYFLGSRPEPYAPVDMEAEVVDGHVSAIDTTRSILAQRFANAVARSGRKFSDYLTDVIGGYDVPDVEVPRWLASKTSKVDGFEVENTTSENQGKLVTLLNSANSDYIYSVDCGSPCIIIGVVTFTMERFYGQSLDRFSFHKDRDDMFNKFMQFVGDQDVEAREYKANLYGQFAYQIRHMEYKKRYPVISGGWRDFLPAMFLIADNVVDVESHQSEYTINSYNIRSMNYELDDFYTSLTNYGLASRFHFQVMFENRCTAKRRMARQPSIL